MTRTLDDILERLRRIKPDLETRYPIRELAVFGSYARGEQTEDSDVDVLVDVGRGMSLFDLAGLQMELADALGVPVDVVTKNSLRPTVATQVLSERIVL
jgi:predicted nucleotidyltransferase